MNTGTRTATALPEVIVPPDILRSALTALGNGKIHEAVYHFDDHFTFNDHALGLEFTDKGRLIAFFHKSREIFPDTVLEVMSTSECGDHVIAEWKITATETVPHGSLQLRFPISLPGASFVRIENERITRWSDYYDQVTSRRIALAAFFRGWVEY
jgi:SnoaL-like domain